MLKGLLARIEKLEAQQCELPTRVHRVIQDGVDRDTALKSYEQEAGVKIEPGDLVIVRVLVSPVGAVAGIN